MNEDLKLTHKFSDNNRAKLADGMYGCFHCQAIILADQCPPVEWIDNGQTALCPSCGIDSVISAKDVPQIEDPEFLRRMHVAWFETSNRSSS